MMQHAPLVWALRQQASRCAPDLFGQTSRTVASSCGDEINEESMEHNRRQVLSRLLRTGHAAEIAVQAFFRGQRLVSSKSRADLSHFQDQEQQALDQTKDLIPKFRARPSLLQDGFNVFGVATGIAAGLAPRPVQMAIWGAVSEVVEEQHTDALRDLLQAVADDKVDPEKVPALREALRHLRDVARAPDGAPAAPDITILQSMDKVKELGVTDVAALIVKVAGKAALTAAARL